MIYAFGSRKNVKQHGPLGDLSTQKVKQDMNGCPTFTKVVVDFSRATNHLIRWYIEAFKVKV